MEGILAFGDSITFGRGASSDSWANMIKKDYEKLDFFNVFYNLGVPGDSTKELLARIKTEAKARVQYYRPDNTFVILIGIGMNDLREVKNTKKPQTSPLTFKRNLLKIVKIAKKHTNDVVLVGITPVDEKRTTPFEGDYYYNKRVQQFNKIIRNIAKGNYIDVYSKLIKTNYAKLLVDGVHPNKKGYAKMYKIIKEFLRNKR